MQQEREEKKAKSRITMINEDIRKNLSALSLEGNFSPDFVSLYMEQQGKMIQFELENKRIRFALADLNDDTAAELSAMAGSLALKVRKADVVTQLNLETTGIYFRTKQFLVDTDNFKVTANSCYVRGTIYASSGKIGGWTISGNDLVGYYTDDTHRSVISGGKIFADSAVTEKVDFSDIDFNPQYATERHTVDLSNASIRTTQSAGGYDNTQFSSLTSYGAVSCTSLTCDQFHCTGLTARGGGEYITIYCEEIVTDSETWSDARLKEDIRDLEESEAAALMELRPVTFRYKESGNPGAGLIAQELKEVADKYGFDGCLGKAKGYYGIAYRQLIPLMIKQIQINMRKIQEKKHENGSL